MLRLPKTDRECLVVLVDDRPADSLETSDARIDLAVSSMSKSQVWVRPTMRSPSCRPSQDRRQALVSPVIHRIRGEVPKWRGHAGSRIDPDCASFRGPPRPWDHRTRFGESPRGWFDSAGAGGGGLFFSRTLGRRAGCGTGCRYGSSGAMAGDDFVRPRVRRSGAAGLRVRGQHVVAGVPLWMLVVVCDLGATASP